MKYLKKFEKNDSDGNGINIIRKFGLGNYFGIVINKSSSNSAPYHNLYHVLCMVKNCYYIANDEGLDTNEIKKILLACLFHDFNHSMGEKSDEENVKNAIVAFEKYSEEDDATNQEVIQMIKSTQYPYIIPESVLGIKEKIIRDADLLQWCEDNHLQQIVFGLLKTEMKNTGNLKKNLEGQIKFINSIKMHTNWAKRKFDKFKNIRLEEYEFLKNMVDEE